MFFKRIIKGHWQEISTKKCYASNSKINVILFQVIYEGLAGYEKNSTATTSSLFGTLMMLKAACINNACYIDRLITSFMRVLQRMEREHLAPTSPENSAAASELLILSLDLVKNRVAVMGQDMRKAFIGQLLVGLIEKSPDVKGGGYILPGLRVGGGEVSVNHMS